MVQQLSARGVRAGLCAAAALSMSVSAFGQTEQLQTAQAAAQAAAQPSPTVRRLSSEEAVRLALEQNLGIQIARVNPQIQDVAIAQSRSFFAPSIGTTIQKQNQTVAATSSLSGGATSVLNGTVAGSVGISQSLPWGGASYSASWGSNRVTTTNLFSTFSPQLNSQLSLNFTQPLMRNFKIDNIRQAVALSRKGREFSDIDLRATVVQTTRQVKNAYWDLLYQIDNLKAARESLELAQQSLKDNTRRVEIGTMAPIDIVDAKVEVARNEEAVIVAQAQIEQAQDVLRTLVFDPATPNFWSMRIEPSETVPFHAQAIDVEAAIRNALDSRTDLREARNGIEQNDISMRYFKNQIMPDVNGFVSYITTGVGGEQLSPVDLAAIAAGLTPNRAVVANRGFGTVVGDVFQGTYPNWTAGVQIGYPLGTSTARANLERAKLQYQQSVTQMKNLEMQVVAQVRNAARAVEANQKRVESATASRQLAEEKLAAEEKKFAAGIRETFFVFQAQRDLSAARSAEVRAIADYNKSLVDFEAVQQVSINGPIGGISPAGAGTIQTGNSAIIRQQ